MKSERKVMDRRQFFHLRFKGKANEKECSRPVMVGDVEGTETFTAIHETEPMGGATIFYLPNRDGKGSRIGISLCSDVDNFVKKDGRIKAIEDITEKLNASILLERFKDAKVDIEKIEKRKRHSQG